MKKVIKITALAVSLALAVLIPVNALSKMGSVGGEVSQIQSVLKDEGYYTGNIDGIVGSATLSALNITQSNVYNSADYELLARIISAEAHGETYLGQIAVGAVVLNRVEHPSFPDTVSGVVYQNGAFSCLYDGQFYEPIADSAYSAARDALNGLDPTSGAIYYYNPTTATAKWIFSRPVITTIGNHVFCE